MGEDGPATASVTMEFLAAISCLHEDWMFCANHCMLLAH